MQQDQLLELIKKKDGKSFDYLYDMYAQSLFGVIHTIVKNKAQAEDVLQDVMIKIWEKIDTYNSDKGRFYTWIVNIARNAAIDKYRSKAYKKQRENLSTDNFVDILEGSYNLGKLTNAIGIEAFVKTKTQMHQNN